MKHDCIFCKIVAGEAPAYKVYENEDFVAFLDINPHAKGHTLVIPKDHHRWVYDVPNFSEYWDTVKVVTNKLQSALSPEFVSYLTYGLDVPHAHIHIIPRENKSGGFVPPKIEVGSDELAELAKKISAA